MPSFGRFGNYFAVARNSCPAGLFKRQSVFWRQPNRRLGKKAKSFMLSAFQCQRRLVYNRSMPQRGMGMLDFSQNSSWLHKRQSASLEKRLRSLFGREAGGSYGHHRRIPFAGFDMVKLFSRFEKSWGFRAPGFVLGLRGIVFHCGMLGFWDSFLLAGLGSL
jgi:hypothetical protein